MSHETTMTQAKTVSHDDHGHHVNYLVIFFALCICTALSVVFDGLPMPKPVTIVLVFAVAVTKALCVMMFFMHLKFEGNWKYVLLAPTTILAIGLPIALMPDIGVSYYTPTAPQAHDWGREFQTYKAQHAAEEHSPVPSGDGATEPVHGGAQPETP